MIDSHELGEFTSFFFVSRLSLPPHEDSGSDEDGGTTGASDDQSSVGSSSFGLGLGGIVGIGDSLLSWGGWLVHDWGSSWGGGWGGRVSKNGKLVVDEVKSLEDEALLVKDVLVGGDSGGDTEEGEDGLHL